MTDGLSLGQQAERLFAQALGAPDRSWYPDPLEEPMPTPARLVG